MCIARHQLQARLLRLPVSPVSYWAGCSPLTLDDRRYKAKLGDLRVTTSQLPRQSMRRDSLVGSGWYYHTMQAMMRLQREGGVSADVDPSPRSVRSPYVDRPRVHQDKLQSCQVRGSVPPHISLISRFRMRYKMAWRD